MKNGLIVVAVAIWGLGLLIGLGFALAGEVTALNDLPAENIGQKKTIETLEVEINRNRGIYAAQLTKEQMKNADHTTERTTKKRK